MSYAINVDWYEEQKNENYFEKWENLGRQALEDNCHHKTMDKYSDKSNRETNMKYAGYCEQCGVSEDSAQPMMNYIYPLDITPSEDAILKVVQQTNCTVMHNTDTDEYFLTLCGGGMDLSQDIALAYMLCQRWIPFELALQVCTQPDLSVYGKGFRKVMRACEESIKKDIGNAQAKLKDIRNSISQSLASSRAKENEKTALS